jgi:hypothetical protein
MIVTATRKVTTIRKGHNLWRGNNLYRSSDISLRVVCGIELLVVLELAPSNFSLLFFLLNDDWRFICLIYGTSFTVAIRWMHIRNWEYHKFAQALWLLSFAWIYSIGWINSLFQRRFNSMLGWSREQLQGGLAYWPRFLGPTFRLSTTAQCKFTSNSCSNLLVCCTNPWKSARL